MPAKTKKKGPPKPRPNNSPKPTAVGLEQLVKDQRAWWREAVKLGERDRKLRNNVHDVEPPSMPDSSVIKEPYIYHGGEGADIADSFVGLTGVRPIYSIDDPGLGPAALNRSEDAEKFANAVRWIIEDELGEDCNDNINADLADFGWSGLVVMPYIQRWRTSYPKRGKNDDGEDFEESDVNYVDRVDRFGATAPVPIGIWHMAAPNWWPVLKGRLVTKSLLVTRVKYSYLSATYPKHFPAEPLDSHLTSMNFDLVEYADDTWRTMWVFGASRSPTKFDHMISSVRHKMPLPEGQAPAVLYRAFNSSDRRPEFKFKGVLRDIYDTLIGKDFVMSRQLTMVQVFMWLTIIFSRDGSGDVSLDEVDFDFGGANTLPDGVSMSILGPSEELPDAELAFSKLDARRQRHWPDILQGIVGGESSGYLFQLTRDTALTKLKPINVNTAQSDVSTMRMIFYAIGGVALLLRPSSFQDVKVQVRHTDKEGTKRIEASWALVHDLINLIRARRQSDLPQDQHSKLDAVSKAKAEGMSNRRAWEDYGGVEDVQQMDDERIAEDIQNSDIIVARRIQDVLVDMDLEFERQEGETPAESDLAATDGPFPPAFAAAFGMAPGAVELQQQPNTGSKPSLTSVRRGTRTAPDSEPKPDGPGGVSGGTA